MKIVLIVCLVVGVGLLEKFGPRWVDLVGIAVAGVYLYCDVWMRSRGLR